LSDISFANVMRYQSFSIDSLPYLFSGYNFSGV